MTRAEAVTQPCPNCGLRVTMVPYDIGSGPEMACQHCEWCWGANGQPLMPLSAVVMRQYAELNEVLMNIGRSIDAVIPRAADVDRTP